VKQIGGADMDKPDMNRWVGKSTEYVLSRSFHELRGPIYNMAGYLNVLKSADLTVEQAQHFIDLTLNYALNAKQVVESIYQYMNDQRTDE